MFHRLTLFENCIQSYATEIDKMFQLHHVPVKQRQTHTSEHYVSHQWQWITELNEKSYFLPKLEQNLQHVQQGECIDYVLQSNNDPIQRIKLAVFDMDSTLIQAEVMDEIAYVAGVGEEVATITASAMAGNIDFEQSFRQRLALLKGFNTANLATINQSITLMPGAEKLMQGLQRQGVYCAILSGGFSYFADQLTYRLGMQKAFSNCLEDVNGILTGDLTGPILDAPKKVELLEQLRRELGLTQAQCLAVGDGANDLPMLNKAGLGVAFHGKPIVRKQAPHQINLFNLDALLPLI